MNACGFYVLQFHPPPIDVSCKDMIGIEATNSVGQDELIAF